MAPDLGIDVETFKKECRLFELLDEAGRLRMMEAAEPALYADGDTIVREGDPGTSMFVIRKGGVRVVIEALEGEKEVARLGAGSFFGEMAVVLGEPRSASVIADGAVDAWCFGKLPIDAILLDYPKVREVLARLSLKRSEMTLEKMLETDDSAAFADSDDDSVDDDETGDP
ncbi:MAG: cyclic nucleotide-binding domain-containing protein [Pseudomonadota bacterium]